MMDPQELHRWSRHWDLLLWTVAGILLAASSALLVGYFSAPSKVLGFVGSALLLLSIFLGAGFRAMRARVHRRMSREERDLLRAPLPHAQWPVQIVAHISLFAAWLYLLLKHYPEQQVLWVFYAVVAAAWFGYFGMTAAFAGGEGGEGGDA